MTKTTESTPKQKLAARFAGWKSTATNDNFLFVCGILGVLAPAFRHNVGQLNQSEIVSLAKKILCRAMNCEATTAEVEEFLKSSGHF